MLSGVLAASLQRSRNKWLSEGIFERYWTKPTKKKNQADTRNPPKESMTRIGPCTLTIEPHVFEVTLYSVKEPQPQPAPSSGKEAAQRPILQYGPPKPASHPQTTQKHAVPQVAPSPYQAAPQASNPRVKPGPVAPQQTAPLAPTPSVIPQSNHASQSTAAKPVGVAPSAASPAVKPSPDPVIQMLATKAATDDELKALMRIVASGKATAPQLKVFQGHIDDLTAVLQARKNENRPLAPSPSAASPAVGSIGSTPSSLAAAGTGPSTARPGQAGFQASASHVPQRPGSMSGPAQPPARIKAEPLPPSQLTAPSQPQAIRSKAPPAPVRAEVTDVVFDFAAGSGDRFLFPKFSILEYLPGGTQVIASFLVVRKGSNSDSGTYDPDLDYYQPVTMRLTVNAAKVLDPLAKVVKSQDEVRRYMDEVMDHMTRAEYVHLAMRLPCDTEEAQEEKEKSADREERENSLKAFYTPPGSVVAPPKQKAVKAAVSTILGILTETRSNVILASSHRAIFCRTVGFAWPYL